MEHPPSLTSADEEKKVVLRFFSPKFIIVFMSNPYYMILNLSREISMFLAVRMPILALGLTLRSCLNKNHQKPHFQYTFTKPSLTSSPFGRPPVTLPRPFPAPVRTSSISSIPERSGTGTAPKSPVADTWRTCQPGQVPLKY